MITIANLTVKDNPSRSTGYQWMWSVIGHPTIQAAITNPGNFLTVDWNAIWGGGSTGSLWKSIRYQERPVYSSAVMLTKVTRQKEVHRILPYKNKEPFFKYQLVSIDQFIIF